MGAMDVGLKRALTLAAVCLLAITTSAQFVDVPAFHDAPPKKGEKLPPILSGPALEKVGLKYAFQAHAYKLAAKIPNVIYQQPCYCHCDRSVGHTSLHSCFAGDHGAHCATCLQELFYAYKMTKAKKTPAQIREGIEHGDWQQIDLQKAVDIN
ncbi:MAG TPA: CYCXC family (seleno)protein [Terriglobales bacterium]|nr:CYCXC family (seleno)protein [Terriglobales bacterium]